MILYHITTRAEWQAAQRARSYASATLTDAGFIHASTREQVIEVANAFYRGQQDLVLLVMDADLLRSEIRWEPPDHPTSGASAPLPEQDLFPHLYGPINLDCVVQVLDLMPDAGGLFDLPDALR